MKRESVPCFPKLKLVVKILVKELLRMHLWGKLLIRKIREANIVTKLGISYQRQLADRERIVTISSFRTLVSIARITKSLIIIICRIWGRTPMPRFQWRRGSNTTTTIRRRSLDGLPNNTNLTFPIQMAATVRKAVTEKPIIITTTSQRKREEKVNEVDIYIQSVWWCWIYFVFIVSFEELCYELFFNCTSGRFLIPIMPKLTLPQLVFVNINNWSERNKWMMVNHNETDRIFVYSEIILNKIVVARGGYAYCAFFKTRRVF